MILAPLQLRDYWLDTIYVRTNREYSADCPSDLEIDFIEVTSDVKPLKSENTDEIGTVWMVFLSIRQSIPEGKNIPYEFSLEMCGIVAAHPSLTGEKLERAVQVNGPSMLFGSAREILRAATGRGPHAPVIIPSTNFFQRLPLADSSPSDKRKETKSPTATKKTTAKPKAAHKKAQKSKD